jgi:hypothetical protein
MNILKYNSFINERYKLLDYFDLSTHENGLNLIESTFNSLPKDDIFDCLIDLSDLGIDLNKTDLIPCIWEGEELIQSKDRTTSGEYFTNFKTKDFYRTQSDLFGRQTIKVLMTEQVEALLNIKSQEEIEQFTNNDVVVRTFTFTNSIKQEAEKFQQWLDDGWMPCFTVVRKKQLSFAPFPKPNVIDVLMEVREKVYNLCGYEMILFPKSDSPCLVFIDKKYIQSL